MESQHKMCSICGVAVVEPYIRCAECGPYRVNICPICFSRGREFGSHESNHSYSIIRSDFALFDQNWTAQEELVLLDLIGDRGLGNWSDVSSQLDGKTKVDCEQHYWKFYVTNPHPQLPKFPRVKIHRATPILFKLSDDPPRPRAGSSQSADMAGYSAARGDFTVEPDNFVELDLNSIEVDENRHSLLDMELQTCLLSIYWNRLRERHRKKRIIRDYGLINLRKLHMSHFRYRKLLGGWVQKLAVFMHLMEADEFTMYLEMLAYKKETEQRILKLMELRENGVTRLRNGPVYDELKARRAASKQRPHLLSEILDHIQDEWACRAWLQNHHSRESSGRGSTAALPSLPRRSAPPLEIIGLPGYERLTDHERQLCKTVRLVPSAYLEFKAILTNEARRSGCLKLAQARSLLKIDVNKTRKIYDFLIQQGIISKSDP